ncbi:phosphoenolpyruvate carboxylase [Marinicella rhabdoformis]|uniref:phosphoenolpyruvate carboxylase n=1 Tax=Marinicella rhabdoformis TaxID=2580566 RepID=UPI0012AEBB21|nr:phosphoenolpyruvate carboxylase [Marinicella rhabdoformis]
MTAKTIIDTYHRTVVNKFQVYNSLFLNLPFDQVNQVGVLLPLLVHDCQQAYQQAKSPQVIIEAFMDSHLGDLSESERVAVLFKFIQYIERQIVLFDAIEEAGFDQNHAADGSGSVPFLAQKTGFMGRMDALREQLSEYHARIVLTAHPTQFYPGPVLGIITELSQAIQNNNTDDIEMLLRQLGKTPLYSKDKPTPYDEAMSLTWYLENVFYETIQDINQRLAQHVYGDEVLPNNSFVELGFWPGGDRDGNPNVTADITLKVAKRLRSSILKCYFRHIRNLKKRLTFKQVESQVSAIEKQLYMGAYTDPEDYDYTAVQLVADLEAIVSNLKEKHQGLFVDQVQVMIQQVHTFGFYFAALDIRQDSRVLSSVLEQVTSDKEAEAVMYDTLDSIRAIEKIQKANGPQGAHRYIISNCQKAEDVKTVMSLLFYAGLEAPFAIDVVPLFETIDDLAAAPQVMKQLYQDADYREHVAQRQNQQTIMLGFSDGTKDGGYIAANWAILRAKENLSEVANQYGIELVFFDGRGGPPARGGGETHQFYASLSPKIQNHATQLTIQGQTISANFGRSETAQYNLEQLLSAGVSNALKTDPSEGENTEYVAWNDVAYDILGQLADISLGYYQAFKDHPKFVPYLEQVSTLKYYGQTNISSRPTKRNDDGGGLNFEDLRAIPFVGAWSQLKQNVLGYYGVGTALKTLIDQGRLTDLQKLYQDSGFFKTLMDNCMMSLAKSYMPLTAYLKEHQEFGDFWCLINEEFERSEQALLAVAQEDKLLANQHLRAASIEIREQIVLPLLTIQQYALQRIEQLKTADEHDALIPVYENMVTRSLYGNINASRNAV